MIVEIASVPSCPGAAGVPAAHPEETHMPFRRALLATAAAYLALVGTVHAQDAWPSRPIKLVVPFAAGGTSDVLARTLAEKLQGALKQTVIVDNKAGAGGVIGADSVAKAPADGYTILLGTIASHAINPALQPKMPYDALKDFAPVDLLGSISNVLLVGATQPYKTVKDLTAAAKAKPGSVAFASAGQGSSQHMSGELFKLLAGAELTHIPYKGSAPAIQDVIGGQVPMSFETVTVALPHIQSGKVRALAVTSAKRSPALPDTPTLQEAGIAGFDVASWQAIYAPAGTPPAIGAATQRRDREDRCDAGREGQVRDPGPAALAQHARRVRRLQQGRGREVDQGREGRQRQAGMTPEEGMRMDAATRSRGRRFTSPCTSATTSRSWSTTAACRPGPVFASGWRCASTCRRATRWRWWTCPRAARCAATT
jgi:tripartite-type tricarboxylate transporter receptor subunit TctC